MGVEPGAFTPVAPQLTTLNIKLGADNAADLRGIGPALAALSRLSKLHIIGPDKRGLVSAG